MRLSPLLASITLTIATAVIGCSSPFSSSTASHAVAAVTTHNYTGTASVGDFITMTFDTSAHTFSYVNHTNGLSGAGTFTVNVDGSYAMTDSSSCFTDAYEVPGFALVLRGTRTGPTQDTVSLVTALQSQVNTVAGVSNQNFNYMQFRTNSGGVEVGFVGMGPAAQVTHASYWPYGATQLVPDAFHPADTFPGSPVEDTATGALKLTIIDSGVSVDNFIFATTSGLLAVDTGNGSLVCFHQAATNAFVPAVAGTYRALAFAKNGVTTGSGNTETPAVGTVAKLSISLDASGLISVTDAGSTVLASGTIAPFDSTLTTGIGNACPGMFHLTIPRIAADGVTAVNQELFLTFVGDALMFSSFQPDPSVSDMRSYDYFYGVALKQNASNG
ncbi:MAG: hypothetical protein H0X38_09340 [Planctomycetes bacterium]|nr:hypothetical protein [Planctomycetota bacterium]